MALGRSLPWVRRPRLSVLGLSQRPGCSRLPMRVHRGRGLDWVPHFLLRCLLPARRQLGEGGNAVARHTSPSAAALRAQVRSLAPRRAAPRRPGSETTGGAKTGRTADRERSPAGGAAPAPKTLPAGSPGGATVPNGPPSEVREGRLEISRPHHARCPVPPARCWEHARGPECAFCIPRSSSDPAVLPHGPRDVGWGAGSPRGPPVLGVGGHQPRRSTAVTEHLVNLRQRFFPVR